MPDIHHDFPIKASIERVFEAIRTPRGLDAWWVVRLLGDVSSDPAPVRGARRAGGL
jgi:uncharacterized protein YndB with AHSA1/START domain